MTRKILPVLLAVGALVFAACGGGDDEGSTGGNGTDRAFVAEMVPHHESAVEMAEIARERGQSTFVKKLAENIITTQKAEISTLRREDEALDTAGIKPGSLDMPHSMMGMDDDPATLRTAKPFDKAFLEMMIPHHKGAVEMARIELEKGKDPELKALAQDIIDAQTREIREMEAQLASASAGADSQDQSE